MGKIKYVLLLPLTYNDGSEVPASVREAIFDQLFLLAGGYHVAGVGKGAYRMKDGSKQVDESLEVWVVVNEEDEAAMKELVGRICVLLDQECVYLERVQSTVEFILPTQSGEHEDE